MADISKIALPNGTIYNLRDDSKEEKITGTASGDIASFETDLSEPLQSVIVDVTATQDLHGEDRPYPAGGGVNQWDEDWELGALDSTTGLPTPNNSKIRSKNYCKCFSDSNYYLYCGLGSSKGEVFYYDANYDFIVSTEISNSVKTSPSGASWFKVGMYTSYGTTYHNDISINYPSTDHDYHPYANICPISGYSSANIVNTQNDSIVDLFSIDSDFRGTVAFNQLIPPKTEDYTTHGIRYVSNNDGVWTLNGTSDGRSNESITGGTISIDISKKFLVCGLPSTSSSSTYHMAFVFYADTTYKAARYVYGDTIVDWSSLTSLGVNKVSIEIVGANESGQTVNNVVFKPQLIDLTQMFSPTIADYIYTLEQNNAGAGVAFFRNIYPEDYYAYDSGTTEIVGKEIPEATIAFGQTVYGGVLDVTRGKLTVTYGIVDFGDLSIVYQSSYPRFRCSMPSDYRLPVTASDRLDILCSCYIPDMGAISASVNYAIAGYYGDNNLYVSNSDYTDADLFKTAMTGQKIVYRLNTPFDIDLTPEQISALVGVNNVFSDTNGTTDIKFFTGAAADIKGVIAASKFNDLADIPNPPSTDGNYSLKLVISDGVPTYSWEEIT